MKKDTIVTTVSGNNVERKFCKRIGDEYYQMNVDCFEIDGKWYRKSNPRIYFNEIEGRYFRISNNTVQGIVSYDPSKKGYQIGKFEKCFENELRLQTSNEEFLVANNFVFNKIPKLFNSEDGRYYDYKYAAYLGFSNFRMNNAYIYSFPRMYNCEKIMTEFQNVDNSKYTENILATINGKFKSPEILKKYSFGLEFETSNGIIPEHRCKELGLMPLRDGSIGGHEYTTIPMKGNSGINLIMNQLEELKKRTVFNRDCSMHVHFGGYPTDPALILNLYNICVKLQDEIGRMFPRYVFNTSKYKRGGKDYCQKLPGFINNFADYYNYMSDGHLGWKGSLIEPHPEDPNRERKWENHKRYFYVNFINMLFGQSPKTVEFRIHTPTFNYSKVINWIFICMAILEYSKIKIISQKDNISIANILYEIYSKEEANVLIEYIENRIKFFDYSWSEFGDGAGSVDIYEDNKQVYKTIYEV